MLHTHVPTIVTHDIPTNALIYVFRSGCQNVFT